MENQKVEKLEIVINAREMKKKDGGTFLAYRTTAKNGRFLEVHFKKVCNNIPKTEGTFICKVLKENISIEKNRLFPRMWIGNIEEEPIKYVTTTVDLSEYI